jgi:hypothetical protein
MKNKLLAVMATLGMVASASAVKVNNNLSINGFIDGSYQLTEEAASKTQELGVDEVELNFVVSSGAVSGLVAVDTNLAGRAANDDMDIEQAHFTYDLGNGVAFTLGRYGSALGFEREDPAGLYTFSRAYGTGLASDFNFGDVDAGSVDGLTVSYAADNFTLAASFEEDNGRDLDQDDLDLELSFTYTGIAGVTLGGGYFYHNEENPALENDKLNIHASKQVGKLLLAGEYSQIETAALDRDAYLLLADYDVNDKLGVALRFSNAEIDANRDYESFTIAPNYAITDSLGAIIEYSDIEEGTDDSEIYAVELTYTF